MPAIRQRFSCSWLLWERQIKPSSKVSAKKGASRRMLSAMLGWYLDQPRFELGVHMSWIEFIPVVPARGGAEVALKIYIYIYKTFLIYRTCMRRAPAKPVRACTLRKWCPVSHVTFEAPLRPSHFSLHSSHSTLHTSHSTLLTSHCTLPNPHFTLHTSHFTVHTSHFTLLIAFFTLHTSHSTLHTALFTPHTSHCTLHTPHFISSELFSTYSSSSLLIASLLICHLSFHESLPSTATKFRVCFVRSCCSVAVQEHDLRATPVQCKHFPHTSHCTLHTQHSTLHTCTSS